jgi:hypothetical protein
MKAAALTAEQETEFDGYMKKWQDRLNLNNWRVERSKKRARAGVMAQVSISVADRLAAYRTGKFDDSSSRELDSTALHESVHILLAPYKAACMSNAGEDAVMSEEHAIVVLMEKLLLGNP